MTLRLDYPSGDDPHQIAEWVEAYMLINGHESLSRTAIRAELKNSVFPDDGIGGDDLSPSELEVATDAVFREIQRRASTATKGYPFSISDGGSQIVVEFGNKTAVYAFMLLISVSPILRKDQRYRAVDLPFDLLVTEALKRYLGTDCDAVRFGSPAHSPRPKGFATGVRWLSERTGIPLGSAKLRHHTGDGGVDVVAWVAFSDNRDAFLVVLAQCTVMKKYEDKGADIIMDRWRGWLDFGKDPLTCLAVPFAIPIDHYRWDDLRRTSHLVMDRFRIAQLAPELPLALIQEIGRWTATEAQELAGSPLKGPLREYLP